MENREEKKFLAYLLTDTKYIAKTLNQITPDHLPHTFYTYQGIVRFYQKHNGIITLDHLMTFFERNKVDNAKRTQTINDFNDALHYDTSQFGDSDFDGLLELLHSNYKRSKLLKIAELCINKNVKACSEQELQNIEEIAKQTLNEISNENSNVRDEGSIQATVKERAEKYKQIKEHPETVVLYKTGFKKIDDSSGGFAPGELIYIIGRQGTGKSALMLNFAHNFWKDGKNVILFSIEISKQDYMRRFDACAAGVRSDGLKRGTLTPIEEDAYNQYLQKTAEGLSLQGTKVGQLYIVDAPSNVTPAFIEAKTKDVEADMKIKFDIIISDYAGIMKPNIQMGELRHNKAEIAWELKQIARKYNKVVISGEQMNRVGKNQKKTENDAIAESDGVTNHIDWGIALRQNTDQDIVTIETFKSRDTGALDFLCRKKFDKMQLEELQDIQDWDM